MCDDFRLGSGEGGQKAVTPSAAVYVDLAAHARHRVDIWAPKNFLIQFTEPTVESFTFVTDALDHADGTDGIGRTVPGGLSGVRPLISADKTRMWIQAESEATAVRWLRTSNKITSA